MNYERMWNRLNAELATYIEDTKSNEAYEGIIYVMSVIDKLQWLDLHEGKGSIEQWLTPQQPT